MPNEINDPSHADGSVQVVTIGTSGSATQVVGDNRRRLALIFSPPATGSITISTERSVTLGNGIILTAGTNPLELSADRHGNAVRRAWFAVASSGAPTSMAVLEVVS